MDLRLERFRDELDEKGIEIRDSITGELRKRGRRDNDFAVEKVRMQASIGEFKIELDNVLNKVATSIESINFLRELIRIQVSMNRQEEQDKQSVALYG